MKSLPAKLLLTALVFGFPPPSFAEDELADGIRKLPPEIVPESERDSVREMVRADLRARLERANRRSSDAWAGIESREQWDAFVQLRIERLRDSLGTFPEPAKSMRSRITGEIEGEGFRIRNVVFESRPGLWVTANLYLPEENRKGMPGIILSHSHHRPKEHGELQDMGMTWARAGCAVLVPDHLGHGERRQHPFASEQDYPKDFRVSRQDYYFRYDAAIQLHLVGESLVGWMVRDLMRGVDYLLSLPGIDPEKIILLGAVAGGGDPAAVAAAIDERIAAAVPFNFGGPQPETRYPLPADVETSFNYAGSGGWESTRNLRRSAADGFLPWVIVGGIAPRRLVFAHEFNWDRPRDPVWKRLRAIYDFHEKPEHLAFTHGKGELKGRPPEASHCTHIGRFHRRLIHPAFDEWFGITVTGEDEFSDPLEASSLQCLTPEGRGELNPKRLVDLLPDRADHRLVQKRDPLRKSSPGARRESLQRGLRAVLGNVETEAEPRTLIPVALDLDTNYRLSFERSRLEVEPGIVIPLAILRLWPDGPMQPQPVVVAVAQRGKEGFLSERPNEIAGLLNRGIIVCLPDLRGTGETREGGGRERRSADTGLSSSELMLGGTLVGARLRDLRSVIRHLESQPDTFDGDRIGIWGDSFAPPNPNDREIGMPRGIGGRPHQSEPLGGVLALLAGLYEPGVKAVYINGGLGEFRAVLASQFVLIPHDVVIPGLLTVADLPDIAAALPKNRLRLENLVDASNRRLPTGEIRRLYPQAAAGGNEPFTEWLADLLNDSPE